MSDHDLDRICDEYLAALENLDHDALDRLLSLAGSNPDLALAFDELNDELNRLDAAEEATQAMAAVTDAIQTHLPTAEIAKPRSGPVTLAEAADLLFRQPPAQLPAETHRLNETLRSAATAIPTDLNLPKLIAWLEPLYGSAPKAYWKALYEAAMQLELRRASQPEYQLAARRVPGGSS